MNFFNMPKPRRFEHKYIYVDERKERLHKSFTADMKHIHWRERRGRGGCLTLNIGLFAIILLVLLIVWRVLLRM